VLLIIEFVGKAEEEVVDEAIVADPDLVENFEFEEDSEFLIQDEEVGDTFVAKHQSSSILKKRPDAHSMPVINFNFYQGK
jgi:hypothetical protein